MRLNPWRRAIVASAAEVPTQEILRVRSKVRPWQHDAWALWKVLGVLHYPTSFMAEQVMRLRWDVWVDGKQLSPEQSEADIEEITRPSGVSEISRRIALNLEVVGEVYYGRRDDMWSTVSPTASKLDERLESMEPRIRGWLADPEDPDKPDSPVRAAIDTAEEIRVMSALMRAQTRNRLAQRGILLFPTEVEFPDGDDFFSKLQTSMTAPISDEQAPSAVVPLYQKLPGDLIDKVKHLVLDFPYDEHLDTRLDGAIKRLALSLNMPPEVLLGLADVNRWNAFVIEDATYRAHIEPLGMNTGGVFARALQLTKYEGRQVLVKPDPTELLARKQSIADAFKAFELGIVNAKSVRDAIGAGEEEAPPMIDEAVTLAVRMLRGAPSLARDPGLEELVRQLRNVLGGVSTPPIGGNGTGPTGTPPTDRQPVRTPEQIIEDSPNGQTAAVDPQDEALDKLSAQLVDIDTRLLSWLDGAAEMALDAVTVRAQTEDIGTQDIVEQELDRLGKAWSQRITGAHRSLQALGIDTHTPEWTEAAAVSVGMLVDGLTSHVMENVQRIEDGSSKLATPVLLLRRVLAAAGGSDTAVVAGVLNPPPTFQDPQGFAIGVLTLKDLKGQDVELVQWRFRYGTLFRDDPFEPHMQSDGQFMSADGQTGGGFSPGDHRGCRPRSLLDGPRV